MSHNGRNTNMNLKVSKIWPFFKGIWTRRRHCREMGPFILYGKQLVHQEPKCDRRMNDKAIFFTELNTMQANINPDYFITVY